MYSSLMSLEDTEAELISFIPRIQNFLASYVAAKPSSNAICVGAKKPNNDASKPSSKPNWEGQILSVQDIEENIWLPNLGIKGKVDVTVKVRSRNVVKVTSLVLWFVDLSDF